MHSPNSSARENRVNSESNKGAIGEINVNGRFCLEIEEEMRLPDFDSLNE